MNLLLDTCTFLWLTLGSEMLTPAAINAFSDPDNEVYLSAVSAWEISVKYTIGRLPLPVEPGEFISVERNRHFIMPLEISEQEIRHLHKLPPLHKDPFDRMLVCQAIEHALTLLTPDPLITQYPIRTIW